MAAVESQKAPGQQGLIPIEQAGISQPGSSNCRPLAPPRSRTQRSCVDADAISRPGWMRLSLGDTEEPPIHARGLSPTSAPVPNPVQHSCRPTSTLVLNRSYLFYSSFSFFVLLSTYIGVPLAAPSLITIEARRSSGMFVP